MSESDPAAEPPRPDETEVKKYRRAAEESLDQLEWCINLLYRIGKPRVADAMAANYRSIRRQMREIST